MPAFLIVARTAEHRLAAVGTRAGRLFASKAAADRAACALRKIYRDRGLEFLVLPLTATDQVRHG